MIYFEIFIYQIQVQILYNRKNKKLTLKNKDKLNMSKRNRE